MAKTSNKQVERDENGRLLPGSTANPNGRPSKGYSIAERMREMFAASPELKDKIIAKMAENAANGDVQAAKYLSSYIDGMPVQTVKNHDVTLEDLIKQQNEPE